MPFSFVHMFLSVPIKVKFITEFDGKGHKVNMIVKISVFSIVYQKMWSRVKVKRGHKGYKVKVKGQDCRSEVSVARSMLKVSRVKVKGHRSG